MTLCVLVCVVLGGVGGGSVYLAVRSWQYDHLLWREQRTRGQCRSGMQQGQ